MYNVFEADSITKSFNNSKILNGIYIKVETGNIIGIFGKNGSGKSTLLEILFGSKKADFSFFRLNGKILKTPFSEKNCVFLVSQDSFLPDNLKVRTVMKLFSTKYYFDDFSNVLDRRISELSLGQLRYLEVFIALNSKSKFVFLDEPFSGLSPKTVVKILKLIKKSISTKGVIIVDHDYLSVLKVTNINMILQNNSLRKINSIDDLVDFNYIKRD